MREILFRAFVKDKGKIYDIKKIDFDYGMVWFEEENKPTDTMRMFDQIELMQYTGLTDKNGKKIFEGDIVADYFGKIYGVVEYGEGSFGSGILKYTGFYCKSSSIFSDGNLFNESDKYYWDKHQVIGNIYDNPELLEVER